MRRIFSRYGQTGCTNTTTTLSLAAGNYTLTATPASGYLFDHYVINGQTVTQNPYPITVSAAVTIQAYFVPVPPPPPPGHIALTVTVNGQGQVCVA